ncbi:hypothetical protein GF345_01510 [Candidatus Woesearchaeota archaeon]|nr:hypothetical protein [Candidatus Woesearchaeota archaeon]
MRLRILPFVIIFIALLLPQLAHADLIPVGTKGINHCFEITNMDEYPDYIFILDQRGAYNKYEMIVPGRCTSFYKFNTGTIYALSKDNQAILSGIRREEPGIFEDSPAFIKSDVHIKTSPYVSILSSVKSITDQYTIISIDDDRLELEKTTVKERDYSIFVIYILAFLATVLLESLIIWPLAKDRLEKGFFSALKYSFFVNILTYPLALLIYILLFPVFSFIEMGVFIAEIFLVRAFVRTSYKRSILISLLANIVTMLLGFAFYISSAF